MNNPWSIDDQTQRAMMTYLTQLARDRMAGSLRAQPAMYFGSGTGYGEEPRTLSDLVSANVFSSPDSMQKLLALLAQRR